jgi:hypothetical protein
VAVSLLEGQRPARWKRRSASTWSSVGVGEALGEADGLGSSGSVGVGTGGMVSGGSGLCDASVGAADGGPIGALVSPVVTTGPTGVETATAGETEATTDGSGATEDEEAGAMAGFGA